MDGFRVRPARDRYEVLEISQPLEPASMLVSGLVGSAVLARRVRPWIVERRSSSREVAAVVVLGSFGHGTALSAVLCFDPEAGATVADVLVASPARRVSGTATHLEPILGHLPPGFEARVPLSVVGPADLEPLASPDPRTRVAEAHDVDPLVALYGRFELELLPGPALRRALTLLVAERRVVVATDDDQVVGAMRCELRTGRHDWWSGYTVLPDHRRHGLGRALERRAQGVSFSLGHRMAGVTAPTNPVPYPASFYTGDDWVERGLPPAPPGTAARVRRRVRRTAQRLRR